MHDRLYVSNHSTVHMHCFKMTDIRGGKLLISKGVSYCRTISKSQMPPGSD